MRQAFHKARLLAMALAATLGCAAFGHGDLHEQIDSVTLLILKGPESGTLYLKRAELFRLHQDWASAAADYDRAALLDPASNAVRFGRARMLLESGKFEEAKTNIDPFLQANPKHAEGNAVRGRIELKQGNPLRAAVDFARSIECSARPEPELYLERAHALADAGLAEHGVEAVDTLKQGMKVLGNLPTLGLYAVELEAAQNRFEGALALLDQLGSSAPRKEHWLERRGDLLEKAGRQSESQGAYRTAMEALAKLPERIRATKAMVELEARLTKKTGSQIGSPAGK